MSTSENQIFKCERCQIETANIVCQSCQPFHYFCPRCDSIVHSMRVKSSHIRQNISIFMNKALNSSEKNTINNNNDNNYSTGKFGDINKELNLPSSSKRYFRTLTPKKQRIIYNNKLIERDNENISLNNDNNINNNNSNNNYPLSKESLTFSKDYLSEINRIHNKEKEALQYKIDTLENNIDRLKLNFQNEIKLMEERMNNILREKKNMEEKYHQIIEMTIKEKDDKIKLLINENNIVKEKNRMMEEKCREKENYMTKNIYECNNQIESLKNELNNARKDNNMLHKNHMNKVSEILKSNNDNIKSLKEMHKKEVDEIYFDGKLKNEKLIQQVENDLNQIEFLKSENQKMRENIRNLEKNNENILAENQSLKDKMIEYSKNLEISRDLNNNLKKNYEKIKTENNNMKNDFDYYENTINGLKRELFLMNDTYTKKEKDFNYLLEQSEKIRKDFSENMFNNEELEFNNRALKKENDELKRTINSFNENHRFCYSYSNY